MANDDWTINEVQLIVNDYFKMFQFERENKKYNKSAHIISLNKLINNRSVTAIEYKHRNISAVLVNMGFPYINGFKPLPNYQKVLLENEVGKYLVDHRSTYENYFEDFSKEIVTPPPIDYQVYFEYIVDNDLPKSSFKPSDEPLFRPMKINYLEKEQNNRVLGESGENLVIEYEKWRLIKAGKENLVREIDWVSKDKGDGAGYDILSKNANGTDRYIEVKTTKLSKKTPIYLTRTELIFADKNSDKFFLYRVFNFNSAKPRIFIIEGKYENYYKLEPITFKGYF